MRVLLIGNAARRHVALLFVPLLLMVSIETYWEWDAVEDHNYGTRPRPVTLEVFVMTEFSLLAYIDPVSGTIVLQLIIAGVIGTIAFFHRSIARVLGLFSRSDKKDADSSE